MPKISIIIPVYNSEKYLRICLNSLFEQTFKDFEIVVVDDGSTDDSQSIVDEYVRKYPNVVKLYSKKNGGQGAARNYVLDKVAGDYVFFMDSDDYIEKNALEILYSSAVAKDSDLVVCDYNEVYANSNKTIIKKAMTNFSDDIKCNYMLSNPSPWNKLIKLDILKNNNIEFLENHIYEDLATLPLLTHYARNITYVEKPLYNYIIRPNSTMRQSTYNKKLDSIFVAIDHLENEFKKRELLDKYRDEMEFLYIQHLLYAASGRFLLYKEGISRLKQIKHIMKSKCPNWRNNKYYKKQGLVFKMTCSIFYSNNRVLLYLYNWIRKMRGELIT